MSTSTGPPETSAAEEDQAIRERVSQILRQGQIDREGVKDVMDVMRAVTGGALSGTAPTAR